ADRDAGPGEKLRDPVAEREADDECAGRGGQRLFTNSLTRAREDPDRHLFDVLFAVQIGVLELRLLELPSLARDRLIPSLSISLRRALDVGGRLLLRHLLCCLCLIHTDFAFWRLRAAGVAPARARPRGRARRVESSRLADSAPRQRGSFVGHPSTREHQRKSVQVTYQTSTSSQ